MLQRFRQYFRQQRDDADQLELDRQRMLKRDLTGRGIRSQRVLDAMARVRRERFVPQAARHHAYDDRALAIDCEQTISQPYIVALMTELLEIDPNDSVLEIGTGSGYQTAVLAELANEVATVERHEDLSHSAQRALTDEGYTNIRFLIGDGTLGWPAGAPYDRILITAAAARPPEALLEQLSDGGRLVAPIGTLEQQQIVVLEKSGGDQHEKAITPCRFVPLIGEQGFTE